jgi:sulfofructosephosphate aldolase
MRAPLARLTAGGGVVAGLAVDHRDTLRSAWRRRGLPVDNDEALRAWKRDVVRALAPASTLVLLDEELGGPALAELPGGVALAMALEAQGYEAAADEPETRLLPDFAPADAAARGAMACKLLLPIRPDHESSTVRQAAIAADTAARCHAAGLLLILEPVVRREPGDEDGLFTRRVVAAARRLAGIGADVLKLQYPGSRDACAALTDACGGLPWVLLGGGGTPERFLAELSDACRGGAAGFIVGRSAWEASLVADGRERTRILESVCLPFLGRCRALAEAVADRAPAGGMAVGR